MLTSLKLEVKKGQRIPIETHNRIDPLGKDTGRKCPGKFAIMQFDGGYPTFYAVADCEMTKATNPQKQCFRHWK